MNELQLKKRGTSGEVGFRDEMPSKKPIPTPPVQIRSLIFWMVAFGVVLFGGLGTWAAFAPINSAVVASGTFEVDGDLQVVQHLEGGIVSEINVHEGDDVVKGQVIAKLDSTRTEARVAAYYNQLTGILAREARLIAEYEQSEEIDVSQEFLDILKRYPEFEGVLALQKELFLSNRRSDEGQVAILAERISLLNQQLDGVHERHVSQKEQLTMVREEVTDLRLLLDKGLTLKSRYLARRLIETELVGDVGESESAMQAVYQQIAEIDERVLQVRRDRNLTIADQLQALNEQNFDVRQRIASLDEIAQRQVIRAPISGRIIGFTLNTVGEVVQPAQLLLKIVPADSTYLVEALVSPADIDEIVLGGKARVRLTSYSFRSTPPVEGKVTYVAADAFYDEATNANYYRVHVKVLPESLAELPKVQIITSMPVQVMIATGEQTVVTYLLDPILSGLETAMVEGE